MKKYSCYRKITFNNSIYYRGRPTPIDSGSPSVNAEYQGVVGGVTVPGYDYFGTSRTSRANGIDIGAVELQSSDN